MFDLGGRTALVTGGLGGLGRATAVALAQMGARVVVSDIHPDDEAAQLLSGLPVAQYIKADVKKQPEVVNAVATCIETHGGLDILVNNAGIARAETALETTLDSWNEVLAVNLTGSFLFAQQALPHMMPKRWGRIIQMSSVVAHQGALRGHAHYAASKGGLSALTMTLARTAAPHGVTVNSVAAGIIDTNLMHATHRHEAEELSRSIPLGMGSPQDVAATVVFLASEEARYITGATIDVNGGLYMR